MGNRENWTEKYGPIQRDYIGDFIGFTWDGMSLSRLGIVRTSDGDRYNENLLPNMQDKTTQIPGADGTYYFNSFYTQKPFNISFAFDCLTEKGIRQLKQLFGDKKIHRLSFDERPYKEYMVKITGQLQLKYIPFDDEIGDDKSEVIEDLYGTESKISTKGRIYKGEGTISLIAFYPYAKSRANTLSELETLSEQEDIYLQYTHQWEDGVYPPSSQTYNIFSTDNSASTFANLYNSGDLETDFTLEFDIDELVDQPIQIVLEENIIVISIPEKKEGDEKVRLNSKTELLEGLDSNGQLTGNLYNDCIKAGDFFKIPIGESTMLIIKIVIQDNEKILNPKISYNYLYY